MVGVITDLGSALVRFPSWWLGELAALLPEGLRRAFRDEPKWLVLDVSGPDLIIRRRVGEKNREVGRVELGLDRPAQRRAIGRLVRGLNLRAATVVLRLPDTHALRKPVDLPLAAEENLREVLAFEMDRQTPFKPDEVHFDYRIVHRDPERQRLQVELTVMPRSVVDEAVAMAGDWELPPQVVDVAGEHASEIGSFNLLPQGRAAAPAGPRGGINFVLGLTAVLLMAAVIYVLFERQGMVATVMAERVADAKVEAEAVTALGEEIDRLGEDGRFLRERKRSAATVTAALDELTRVLPDRTWLYELRLNNGELGISGYSSAASEVIALIEDSPRFREVKFRSPVTRDTRLGLERFNLSATVAGTAEPE